MPKLEKEYTKKISVMVTPSQHRDIHEMAHRCGLSVSCLMRYLFDAVNGLQQKKDDAKKNP
jgi:hypothetical protein